MARSIMHTNLRVENRLCMKEECLKSACLSTIKKWKNAKHIDIWCRIHTLKNHVPCPLAVPTSTNQGYDMAVWVHLSLIESHMPLRISCSPKLHYLNSFWCCIEALCMWLPLFLPIISTNFLTLIMQEWVCPMHINQHTTSSYLHTKLTVCSPNIYWF